MEKETLGECNHRGFYNGVSQTVLPTHEGLIVVASYNCSNCGKVFNSVNPILFKEHGMEPFKTPNIKQGGIIPG